MIARTELAVENALRLTLSQWPVLKVHRQFTIPNAGVADLVTVERCSHEDRIVTVYEVKRDRASSADLDQLCRYMVAILDWRDAEMERLHLEGVGYRRVDVHGVLVAHRIVIGPALYYLSCAGKIKLMTYTCRDGRIAFRDVDFEDRSYGIGSKKFFDLVPDFELVEDAVV